MFSWLSLLLFFNIYHSDFYIVWTEHVMNMFLFLLYLLGVVEDAL